MCVEQIGSARAHVHLMKHHRFRKITSLRSDTGHQVVACGRPEGGSRTTLLIATLCFALCALCFVLGVQ